MKPSDFILKIINIYQDARVSRYADKKIRRGRSPSISSIAEDLLASYLIYSDKEIDFIYVDQPIHIPNVVKSFIPDIVVVRNDVITAFLDLKMDLGYKRKGLIDLCEKDHKLLGLIRGKDCTIKDGQTKEKTSFAISESAIYDIVVVSDQNIGKATLKEQLSGAKTYNQDVSIHILTEKEHPNTYGVSPEELMDKLDIKNVAFDNMLTRIK